MIGKTFANEGFQTFFVSQEQSNCPLIVDIIRFSKNLEDYKLGENVFGVVSMGYGKRMLINRRNMGLKDIKIEDIVEIADYDPIKKIALIIGKNEPHIETPVHWLVHHARNDVNAVIQINSEDLIERFSKKLPITEKEYPSGSLELAKEVLKTLRESNAIIISNQGVLFVGTCLKEVEDLIRDLGGNVNEG